MPVYTFQVYRGECGTAKWLRKEKHGVMVGAIRASLTPCEKGAAQKFGLNGAEATHTLREDLFTLARPGDVITGGLWVYDVVAVKEVCKSTPYSAIYVKRREKGA